MKKLFFYLLLLIGTLVILATLGSAIATEDFWWIKILDFPRLQFLILAILLIPLFIWLADDWGFWKVFFLIGLVATIIIQCFYLYPYTELVDPAVEGIAEEEAAPASTFDLMVANVYMHNRQAEDFIHIVQEHDPDILLAMETNNWWEEALQPLDEAYPYGMEYPLDNTYGMILYSKYPLLNQEILFLQYDSVPSFHAQVQLPSGSLFNFHGVHPVPPFPGEPNDTSDEEVALVKVGEMVEALGQPAVVAGDLNDVAWAQRERLFETEGLLYDTRIGRGIIPTFSAKSWIAAWPLDYVFVTNDFALIELKRLEEFGSDHYPLYTKISLQE
ncbi:endonuclease/exonuclease/phosphatase family protein [Nafulsella turpanensis]|uniref:endonuclease/exonuclease/phosphatase family protein n=1 Tax=Nafulsella turpanensis TaxID=1265690 RepID=UPI000348099A|nr:endonuclease/exonuclease/phosphatase family protein [Nafulsella turpanensis]